MLDKQKYRSEVENYYSAGYSGKLDSNSANLNRGLGREVHQRVDRSRELPSHQGQSRSSHAARNTTDTGSFNVAGVSSVSKLNRPF